MRNVFCLLILLLTTANANAIVRDLKSVRLIADTSGLWFLNGTLPIGCEVTYENGKKRRTTGYLNGNMNWKNFQLKSEQGEYKSGVFIIDIAKAEANERKVVIEVSVKGESISGRYTLRLPNLVSIAVLVPESQRLLPGTSFNPEISFYFSNGKRYRSNPWSKHTFISGDKIALFYNKDEVTDGLIRIPENVIESGDRITLSALWKKDRSIFDVRIYTLDFDFVEYMIYKTEIGKDGLEGTNGSTNQNGGNGMNGEQGQNGREVHVYMWLDSTATVLQLKSVSGENRNEVMLKPGIGKVDIEVRGGTGGNGGDGGKGGDAASNTGDSGGVGGNGGNGGNGGDGGVVKIWCDSLAEGFLSQININNLGGAGGFLGKGGKGGEADDGETGFLIDLFFPSRNSKGYDGVPGSAGNRGPEAEIVVESADEVKKKFVLEK